MIGLVSCANDRPTAAAPDFLVERTGGGTSAREFRGRPFNQSARSLTNKDFARFGTGAIVFDRAFTEADGLGPAFNENSCLTCHLDGEVKVSHREGDPGPGLLLRLSVPGVGAHGGPKPEPTYGLQLQTDAVGGAKAEGRIDVAWTEQAGRYPDGTRFSLRTPRFRATDLAFGPMAADTMTSARIAPPMTGMGLLEGISEADVLAKADPGDANHDGISGRPNRVWDSTAQATVLGRFGWKAAQPTTRQQSVAALLGDMGVTSPDAPDICEGQGTACQRGTGAGAVGAVDMSAADLADQVFYNLTIAVPIARHVKQSEVIRGANSFVAVGCSACHTTTQHTGANAISGLANQTFHPFTDLLLHDMGPGLSDGRPDFQATGSEWRTAPLWALGRRAEVTKFHSLLHDGRARTIEEAVLWHGGEASAARKRFMELPAVQRADLLAFLSSL